MNNLATSSDHLVAECRRIEQYAQVNAATHFLLAARAATIARIMGTLPVILGGAIAGTVLWNSSLLGPDTAKWFGLASILAGIVSSLMAYLNPEHSRSEHMRAGTNYKTLENQARRAHEIYHHEETREEFVLRIRELSRRYDELGEVSTQTTDWAYRKANERVKEGTYDR